jgi:2-oxoglutarate dehydrogenase E2 component (dihydrolipoamide succinyltransferase)
MERIVNVKIPALDLGNAELRASVWHAKPGQRLCYGDRLLEVWGGDVIVDIPAPADGTLGRQLVVEDEVVTAGQIVATIKVDS